MNSLQELLERSRVLDLGPLPAPRLDPSATVQQAVQMMVRARRGAVVVVERGRPAGIFTERDLIVRPVEHLLDSRELRARTLLADAMSRPPTTVRRQATLAEAIDAMAGGDLRHLVVVDGKDGLRGLLTASDMIQFLTDQFPEDTVNLPPRLRQQYQRPEGA